MKYQKFTQLEHILKRPDTYIGSLNQDIDKQWVLNEEKTRMIKKNVTHVPGLYKIFDEILVNAIDQCVVDSKTDQIKININQDEGCVSVLNTGHGVPIEIHDKYNKYIPEMIFGELLTSSNYDDNEERITGGRNGYGAKLTNVFSKRFSIEIIDCKSSKQYYQEWSDNMTKKSEPKITKTTKNKGHVKITFWPDLPRFGLRSFKDDDIVALFEKRVYDCCACTPDKVKIYLNDEIINIKCFEKYIDLYIGDKKTVNRVYDGTNERWKIGVAASDGYNQVSFVNGINTYIGGSHVDAISNQIIKQLIEYIESKHKNIKVKPQYIKEHLFIFVNATLVNPSFSSQTKSECTSRYKDFGSRYVLNEEFIKKVAKIGILDDIVALAKHKESRELNKTDGKKKSIIKIPKLDDAIKAGGSQSTKCTLILTEGDSAKTFAISGLSIIGRDYYGVFPLRGKLLNVRDATMKQLMANEEINNLKQILGLQQDKKYTSVSDLRYGKIMILTDSDVDGSHIKGVIMNFIHTFWPGLLDLDFICSMKTPILKAFKKNKTQIESFYTKKEYDEWRKNIIIKDWNIKYYKGLGTSTAQEAKEYFKDLTKCKVMYTNTDETSDIINLAFNKKNSDDRKEWLQRYKILTDGPEMGNIQSYKDFINKDLIHFSVTDVMRSIPNIMDGLKPSQRKVIYVCRKNGINKELKVSQLSGIVSSQSMYHNGEQSLMGCIIGLAQNFVGSNNINLLVPEGQFGTRLMGGHDSASPRYIFTKLSNNTNKIFDERDDDILNYLEDDGVQIEPDFFLPTIPIVLVNGVDGIGTGYSSKIPCFNPKDVIQNIRNLLDNKPMFKMTPWYKNFKGTIIEVDNTPGKYITKGIYEVVKNEIIIKELPIGRWTNDFKELLDTLVDDKIQSFENHSSETNVMFKIKCKDITNFDIEKELKLTTTLNTTNMHLFDENLEIQKFNTPEEILKHFFTVKLKKYTDRKRYMLKILNKQKHDLNTKLRFIKMVVNEEIKIFKRNKGDIINDLFKFSFDKKIHDTLLSIPIHHFTNEMCDDLFLKSKNIDKEYENLLKESEHSMWKIDFDKINL